MKVISILSGGLDSTILTYKLINEYGNDNVYCLTFDYGQRHNIELNKAKNTCNKFKLNHKILNMEFLGDIIKDVSCLSSSSNLKTPSIKDVLGMPQPITYVPYRNLIFSSIALSYAESVGADKVYLGIQAHDLYQYWDCSENFYKRINDVSNLNRQHNITIETPFINMSKEEEIKIGIDLRVDFNDTWTCYNPYRKLETLDSYNIVLHQYKYLACGKCPSCAERIMNFAKAGIKDPIEYNINIGWDELIEKNSNKD